MGDCKGKVTIIVESNSLTTHELEEALHAEVNHLKEFGFSDLDEAEFFIVPSDDMPYDG